jgi:integrase
MTAEALAGVLESIAFAIRTLPTGAQVAPALSAVQPAPPPPPPPPPAPPSADVPIMVPAVHEPAAPAPVAQEVAPVAVVAAAPVAEPADGMTMAQWLPIYRQIIRDRGYNRQTLRNRGASIKFIEQHLGPRALGAIKPHEITTLLKTCSPHKAVRVLGELRDVFTEAIANDEAEANPAALVKPPRAPGIRKRLTLEIWQDMLLMASCGQQRWVIAMLLLALHTGQRRADLAKMRFDDVVDGHLRVEQQKKAGKPMGARLAIPLSLRLECTGMTLGEVIEFCERIATPGDTLLRQANGKPIEMSSLSARFHELIVAVCGRDAYRKYEWPSLHEVRSLSARTYMAEGMPAQTVQSLLGHKNKEMTEVYLDDRGLTAAEWKTVEVAPA